MCTGYALIEFTEKLMYHVSPYSNSIRVAISVVAILHMAEGRG